MGRFKLAESTDDSLPPGPKFTAHLRESMSFDQAAISVRNVPGSPIHRSLRRSHLIASSPLTAMFSQLPPFGMERNSIRRTNSLARAGSTAR